MSDAGHDELIDALDRRGFELAATMPAVAGPIPEPTGEPAAGIELSSPVSTEEWDAVIAVQRDGFALPADTAVTIVESIRALGETEPDPRTIEIVLARHRDEPAGIGFVSHRAGVAGMWSVATLPTARGLGVGSAIIDHRFNLATARGERVAFMFSGGSPRSAERDQDSRSRAPVGGIRPWRDVPRSGR